MALQTFDDGARLLPGAPEAVSVQATYVVNEGWILTIGVRRQFQTWRQAARGVYERLTTEELAQVLEDTLGVELEL